MKRIFTLLIISCLTATLAEAQLKDWGIGIKFGAPTAISLKRYMGDDAAMEFTLGTNPGYKYDYEYYYDHDSRYKNNGYSYDHGSSFAMQLRYYFRKELDLGGTSGFEWYWGPGIQFRNSTGTMHYWDGRGYQTEKVNDLDLGVDVVLGAEYTFDNAPVSISLDFNPFIEMVDRFHFHWQGGLGVRYNF